MVVILNFNYMVVNFKKDFQAKLSLVNSTESFFLFKIETLITPRTSVSGENLFLKLTHSFVDILENFTSQFFSFKSNEFHIVFNKTIKRPAYNIIRVNCKNKTLSDVEKVLTAYFKKISVNYYEVL